MTWTNYYLPPSETIWQGRADTPAGSAFFQIIKMLDLRQPILTPNQLAFGILGFRCDEGIRRNLGRIGAAGGPIAIRRQLSTLPMQRQEIDCYDAGDITCIDNDLESAQQALGEVVSLLLEQRIVPIVLGGGHELAWGHFQGITKKSIKGKLGIINFDAHFDMRPLLSENQGSSGTSFLQMAHADEAANQPFNYHCIGILQAGNALPLFTTAKKYHTQILFADELQQDDRQKGINFVDHAILHNDSIYVSICLDVFSSAYAPGVSAPQPLGLTPWQVIPLLRKLAASSKVISYDLAELSPKYDIDNRTAQLAANIIYDIIHHHKT